MAQEVDADAQRKSAEKLLKSLVGEWEGTCKTWTRPGVKPDVAQISGEFKAVPGTSLMRHSYQGTVKGKPRSGEETIGFNPYEGEYQVSWFDTFHMNFSTLFSVGKPTDASDNSFTVLGKYRMAPDQEFWNWRTEYEIDDDTLTITAFNITPKGQEAKAVELIYKRKQK